MHGCSITSPPTHIADPLASHPDSPNDITPLGCIEQERWAVQEGYEHDTSMFLSSLNHGMSRPPNLNAPLRVGCFGATGETGGGKILQCYTGSTTWVYSSSILWDTMAATRVYAPVLCVAEKEVGETERGVVLTHVMGLSFLLYGTTHVALRFRKQIWQVEEEEWWKQE
ncbi:hypothetical protein EGR_11048 [Echinococcus granulosus]|uniref:Uncharacterized protein n=1 Tax=Echinococcus granulosus TaxID=6210 RepID=W6U6V2_ECHGR|nr:hypothetical protein EGR_11048 [Echinococcus granulosus]EUB54092.1 hypothetical protein EGR_11048 [Echinococcus granulosus]